jgi:hypothetical protein
MPELWDQLGFRNNVKTSGKTLELTDLWQFGIVT